MRKWWQNLNFRVYYPFTICLTIFMFIQIRSQFSTYYMFCCLGFGPPLTRPFVKLLVCEALRWSCWSVVGVTLLVPCLFSSSLYQSSTSPLWAATSIPYVSVCSSHSPNVFLEYHWFNGYALSFYTESFWGAFNTRAAEDSICTCQPRQIHGDW